MKVAARIERLTPSLVREILAVAGREDVISFAGGLPAGDVMPRLDLASVGDGYSQYGTTEGEPVLRAQVADLLRGRGLSVDPEQVLITAGSQQGIDLVSKLFIDEGAPVLTEAPSYLAALQCFTLFGARYRCATLAPGAGPEPDSLDRALAGEAPRLAYLIPDFQNPSGCCYSLERRRLVAASLSSRKVPLVEDAPYRDLAFDRVDRTPIASLVSEGHPWIYLGSFSKVAIPALRVGYLACSASLHPLLTRLKQASDLHTSRPAQAWLSAFIDSGRYETHVERLTAFYRERRDAMAHSLRRHFGDDAQWELPRGGLFFWVRVSQDVDTYDLLQAALAAGVAFMPGRPFFPQQGAPDNWMRLNFSHAAPERIDEGVRRLAGLIASARETAPVAQLSGAS